MERPQPKHANLGAHRQAQAGALVRIVRLEKGLEDLVVVGHGDAGPIIRHLHLQDHCGAAA